MKATIIDEHGEPLGLVLTQDQDEHGRWRWINETTEEDSEISGATMALAVQAGFDSWPYPFAFEVIQ